MATIQDVLANPAVDTTSLQPHSLAPLEANPTVAAPANPAGQIDDTADPDIPHETKEEALGVGTQGEVDLWQARYSMKNFVGRLVIFGTATIAWAVLATSIWGFGYGKDTGLWVLAMAFGIFLGISWVIILRKIFLARFGHFYRLTNRRVFVCTGVFGRREDQMELLRIQDVFIQQHSLMQRMLCLGTVALVPNDKSLPNLYLAGVNDPQSVMDMVWDHARSERDRRSVKVDSI